jgi:hypothetical protein
VWSRLVTQRGYCRLDILVVCPSDLFKGFPRAPQDGDAILHFLRFRSISCTACAKGIASSLAAFASS